MPNFFTVSAMPNFLTVSAVLPRDTFQYRSLNLKSPSQERSSSAQARGPIASHAQSPSAQPLWRESPDSGRALGIIHSLDGESAHFKCLAKMFYVKHTLSLL
jgi:hypothetical protein